VQARHVAAQAGEDGSFRDAFLGERGFDIGAQRAIADQQEVTAGQRAANLSGDAHPI
jgi:hypothetical protein